MKRLLLTLVGAIVVLDAAVIGLYYAMGIQARPIKQQQIFVAVWVVLTLIVVTTMLRKLRVARRGR
jgi:nitric oxide reductase large subunit